MLEQSERVSVLGRLLSEGRRLFPWTTLWWIAAFSAFEGSLGAFGGFLRRPADSTLDYPIQIISTFRILHGEMPFRDFQTLYGPLGYYLAAVVVWPFRSHTPVTAVNYYILACLVLFYAILCTALAGLRLHRPLFLVGAAVLVAASANAIVWFAWYSLPMLLPVVLATIALQFTVPSPARRPARVLLWQGVTGALIAAQMFIRFNFGVYLVFAILLVAAAAFFFGERRIVSAALRCLAFALVFLALLSIVFAAAGILLPFLSDMRTYLPRAVLGRGVPWKYVDHTVAYATAASLAATLLRPLPRVFRRRIDFSLVPYIVLTGLFTYTFVRFEPAHLLPFMIFSLLLLADPSDEAPAAATRPWYRFCFGLPELQLFGLLLLFQLLSPMHYMTRLERRLLHIPPHIYAAGPEPGVLPVPEPMALLHQFVLFSPEADMLHRLDKLRNSTDEVYWMSAPDACQSTFDMCTNIGLYLADNTLPRQPIWYFDTASTPYPDIQQRIVDGLQARRTPWIGVQDVFVPDPIGGPTTRSTLLIDYVLSHYSLVFTTDIPTRNLRYRIYSRRPQR